MLSCCCAGLWLAAAAGCAPLLTRPAQTHGARSPLKPAQATDDAVTLEIIFARCAIGQADINGPLWNEIDEQHLDSDLRRRLTANGMRAGLISSHIPAPIAKLIHYTADPLPAETQELVPLAREPVIRRRLLQVRDGGQSEILATGNLPELPVLVRDGAALGGQTFRDAQGLLLLHSQLQSDGGLQIRLTPEIRHGEAKQQWTGSEGMFRLEMARRKQTYHDLATAATLTPGQMLVVTCLPDRPGSLGYQFFTDETTGTREQKVLLIRLAQLPPAELYLEE